MAGSVHMASLLRATAGTIHSFSRQLSPTKWTRLRKEIAAKKFQLRCLVPALLDEPFEITLRNLGIVDQIEPVGQTISSLRDLQFDSIDRGIVIRRVEIACLERRRSFRHDNGAYVGITIRRPPSSRRNSITDSVAFDPARGLGLVAA